MEERAPLPENPSTVQGFAWIGQLRVMHHFQGTEDLIGQAYNTCFWKKWTENEKKQVLKIFQGIEGLKCAILTYWLSGLKNNIDRKITLRFVLFLKSRRRNSCVENSLPILERKIILIISSSSIWDLESFVQTLWEWLLSLSFLHTVYYFWSSSVCNWL